MSWGAGDLGSMMLGELTDLIAGEERKPGVDPASVQDTYNRQRDGVRRDASAIGFHGDYRPKSVDRTDNFDSSSTAQLRAKVDRIDITAVDNLATAWNEIGKRADTSLTNFTGAMKRATDEGVWRGASRNAVAKAVSDYGTEAVRLSHAATLTGNKIAELKSGLEPTKALVPHAPEPRSNVENARHWIAGRGWRSNDEAQDSAHAEAVRVLTSVYAPVIHETDTNVPVIPKPVDPTSSGPIDTRTGNGPMPVSTKSPTIDRPSSPPDAATRPPSATEPATTAQGTGPDPTTTAQSTNLSAPQSTPRTDSPATSSAAVTNPTGANPTGANPTGANPGPHSTPRTSSPGSGGSGGSGGRSATPPSPGRSVTGSPSTAGTAGVAARAGAGAATSGRSGTGGMGAPGSRGGGNDDESGNGVPDYLINQRNGAELTGLDSLPGTVPPVIGE